MLKSTFEGAFLTTSEKNKKEDFFSSSKSLHVSWVYSCHLSLPLINQKLLFIIIIIIIIIFFLYGQQRMIGFFFPWTKK